MPVRVKAKTPAARRRLRKLAPSAQSIAAGRQPLSQRLRQKNGDRIVVAKMKAYLDKLDKFEKESSQSKFVVG